MTPDPEEPPRPEPPRPGRPPWLRWGFGGGILVFLLVIFLLILFHRHIRCQENPKVYWVAGTNGNTGQTYNILFLGDGWANEDEMHSYRKAVADLSSGLIQDPTFCRHKGNINVFRIDTLGSKGVASNCSNPCGLAAVGASSATPADSLAPMNSNGNDTVAVDFESEMCWTGQSGVTGNSCNLIWMDSTGQAKALSLAHCAPDINVVVVLVNAANVSGGGVQDAMTSSPSQISLLVMGIPTPQSIAQLLFNHELGHALGLYDEYSGFQGDDPDPSFDPTRNIFEPLDGTGEADPCWTPDSGLAQVPWNNLLQCATWAMPCDCVGSSVGSCAQPWVWVPAEANPKFKPPHPCCAVTGSGWDKTACSAHLANDPCDATYSPTISNECLNSPGLWEGGYYRYQGYYRARPHCTMRNFQGIGGDQYCEACVSVIDASLKSYSTPVTCGP